MATRSKKSKVLPLRIRILWWIIIIATLVTAWIFTAWLSFIATPARDTYTFATSFSVKQADSLGVDWQENYTALLDDLEIRQFRLMSYWDDGEREQNEYSFEDLDWQMDEAAKRGAKVSLAIGLRQPRWPECHEPKWATALSAEAWRSELFEYIETVVTRYNNHPALESFQLENEALAWWFGDCRENPDPVRINQEFELVKSLTNKPVWMSLSDQYGLSVNPPIPDAYGYSLYLYVYNNVLPGTYINPSPPVWFHNTRAMALKTMHDKPFFLHELQLEPWGPREIRLLSEDEQNITMSPEQIKYNLQYARKLGFDQVYTWGAEWWYWRKTNGSDVVWETIREEIKDSRTVNSN